MQGTDRRTTNSTSNLWRTSRTELQARAQPRTGSAVDMDRWVGKAAKLNAAEGDKELNKAVREMLTTEEMTKLRSLETHLHQTEWMFGEDK